MDVFDGALSPAMDASLLRYRDEAHHMERQGLDVEVSLRQPECLLAAASRHWRHVSYGVELCPRSRCSGNLLSKEATARTEEKT